MFVEWGRGKRCVNSLHAKAILRPKAKRESLGCIGSLLKI